MNPMFDHEFAGALCHQHVAIEVAIAPFGLNPARQILKLLSPACADEPCHACMEESGLSQNTNLGHVDAAVPAKSTVAAQGSIDLAERRHVDDPGNLLTFIFQTNERAPQGNAPDEVARAVNGVDDPAETGGA